MDLANRQYPALENFFLVSGDLDFSRVTEELVKQGKKVHVLSLADSQNSIYKELAKQYAGRLTAMTIERMLEDVGDRAGR